MTSETIKLNLIPGGDLPVLHSSQFDTGRALTFEIYDGEELFTSFDAYDISLHARKVDGTIIGIDTYNVDSENNQVIFFTTEQLTACAGKNICELVFTDSISGSVVGSCNFWLEVEGDPYSGGIDSASDIENLSTQIAAIVDGQLDNYYTKEEIDDQIETIVTEQVTPIVSSIVAEQVPPAVQAELTNYYTKSETDSAFYNKGEVDILLSGKADISDLPDMDNYYDKTTTDTLLASKANTSTTYTKTEVDNLIAAIPSNDITTEITTPASVQTFNDGGDNIPVKSLVTEILPIQEGSGVPSPSNVRAISGFNTVDVVVSGTNLYNKATRTDDSRLNVNTGTVISGSSWCVSDYIPVKGGESYYLKLASMNSSTYGSVWYDKNKTRISGIPSNDESVNKVHTAPNDACYLRITTSMTGNYAVNYPSTITDYVEFVDSNTHTITLPETIYGGTAELVGGNGSKTYERVALDSLNWTYDATVGHERFSTAVQTAYKIPATVNDKANLICEILQNASNVETYSHDIDNSISFANTGRFYLYISGVTDTTALASIISGKYLVIELATSTAFTFTGANIATLSGTNNIYTDCGDIQSLEYFNNKADDIATMISLMTRS